MVVGLMEPLIPALLQPDLLIYNLLHLDGKASAEAC
jgi:hypothetical protein